MKPGTGFRRVVEQRAPAAGIVASILVLMLCHSRPAAALEETQGVLAEYSLTTWGGTTGFIFGTTHAVTQDATGYLWLGTSLGLVRFDGIRFVPWRIAGVPLDSYVTALRATSDGSLWVGLTSGIVRIRNEDAKLYTQGDGFGGELVDQIVEDRDQTIWASTATGVWRMRQERWQQVGAPEGLARRPSSALFVDPDGVLWVGTSDGIFRRTPHADAFTQVSTASSTVRAIAADARGTLWATDPLRTLVNVSDSSPLGWAWPGSGTDVLLDRRGNMWVGTLGQGVLRVRAAGRPDDRPEQISRKEGLAADSVRALFEDREGNLWVGLDEGLTRLSQKRVTTVAEGETVSALATTTDGNIWVGTNAGLIRLTDGAPQRYTEVEGLPGARIASLHADRDGGLWVATNRGLARKQGARFVPVRLPNGVRLQRTRSITTDAEGGAWIADLDDGLFRFAQGALTRADAPEVQRPQVVYADRAGRVWLGQFSGNLVLHDRGRFASYSAPDRSDIGTVTSIYEDSRGVVWVGTTTGLGRVENDEFVREEFEDFANGVLAITEDGQQRLWIATRAGILHARLVDSTQAGAGSSRLTEFQVYDTSDGLPGLPVRALPAVVRAPDGALLFATGNGAARIVPERLPSQAPRPEILIETLVADDRELEPKPQTVLPPGTSRIEFQYTVLTLTSTKSRFQYRLDGYDQDWVRAGRRREAVYTNLPPGRYLFRVASDGGGAQQEARWDFIIQPAFHQTKMFAALAGGFVVLLLSAAWRLRLLQVRNQFRAVLTERVRIAREIHDTLLQGLFGVGLQVDGISKQLESSPEGTKERLEAVRRLVSRYIRETRSSIWLLRSPSLGQRDLPTAIRETAETLVEGSAVQLNFQILGSRRPLSGQLEEQLLRIVHEAIVNVVKHARATTIQLELRYAVDSVSVFVSDDGCGFDSERRAGDDSSGWGLIGMGERAREVGGKLKLSSHAGSGTQVELTIPTGDA